MRPGVPALPLFSLGGFLVPSVAPGPSGGGLVSLEYASRYSRGSFSPIRQKAHSHISYFIIDHTFTSFRDTQLERDGHKQNYHTLTRQRQKPNRS